ncbi:MAG: ankyrin repeat domain-containing protein [Candidatus Gastranaerophilales bacterium]|nr:ankyrin repeat domain-containing protein [Candidatus Gastranaerophilales bacterium]MCM1073643.1 ankyrin repeat domain-containing protein [Bacteroides sp.]
MQINSITLHSSMLKTQNFTRPVFKARTPMLVEASKYLTGNVEFNPQTVKKFTNIISERNFDNYDSLSRFLEILMPAVSENLSNPFSGIFLLKHLRKLSFNFLKNGLFNREAVIYKGLTQHDYNDKELCKQLGDMFRHLSNNVKMKDEEMRTDIAFREAIRNNNPTFLRVIMDDRELIPKTPDGEIAFDIIAEGKAHHNPQIRCFFDDRYLLKKANNRELLEEEERGPAYQIFTMSDLYRSDALIDEMEKMIESMPPRYSKALSNAMKNHNVTSFSKADPLGYRFFTSVKAAIDKDEEDFGQVRISTISNIVKYPEFSIIKNKSLNISGSKVLHLLAEININPNNANEQRLLKEIISELENCHYDFNAVDDFGETALKKAVEAENVLLVRALAKIANPYFATGSGSSALDVIFETTNQEIKDIYGRRD